MDHTADVIVHAWGHTFKEAMQNGVRGIFGYMTDLEKVEERASIIVDGRFEPRSFNEEMLFRVLDECLVQFTIQDYFIIKRLEFRELDNEHFTAVAYGENMDLKKHTQGTEVKAVTMHGLSVKNELDHVDIHFLLDI